MNGPTLTEALASRGLTHAKAACGVAGFAGYARHIIDAETGEILFTGTAHETWAWLRARDERRAVTPARTQVGRGPYIVRITTPENRVHDYRFSTAEAARNGAARRLRTHRDAYGVNVHVPGRRWSYGLTTVELLGGAL